MIEMQSQAKTIDENIVRSKIALLTEPITEVMTEFQNIVKRFRAEEKLIDYIKLLQAYRNSLIIAVSAKDNIGLKLTKEITYEWLKLGFKTEIGQKSAITSAYRSYIAILDGGAIKVELLGSMDKEPREYNDDVFEIKSTVYVKYVEPITLKYKSTEYSINRRGLNFAVIDKESEQIIDTVCFDTRADGYPCFRIDPKMVGLDKDGKFEYIVAKLKSELNLGVDNRVGLLASGRGGDYYSFVSCVAYACKALKKSYVVITLRNGRVSEFVGYHNENGAKIEMYCLNEFEINILKTGSDKLKSNYSEILNFWSLSWEDAFTHNSKILSPVRKNLTYPKFPPFDPQKYIDEYGIIPGKTVIINPLSNTVTSLPVFFWNTLAEILKVLGFVVLFEVPDNKAQYYYGKNIFCEYKDAVGVTELCGWVIGVMSGYFDYISTSKAKMIIFSTTYPSIADMYNIDNSDNHIQIIRYPDKDTNFDTFSFIKPVNDYLISVIDPLKNQIDNLIKYAKIFKQQLPELIHADLTLLPYSRHRGRPNDIITSKNILFSVKFAFYQQNNFLVLLLNVDLPEWECEITLKRGLSGEKIIEKLKYYNQPCAIFSPDSDLDAVYSCSILITDKKTKNAETFVTNFIHFKLPKIVDTDIEKIQSLVNFEPYVYSLFNNAIYLIIFISSRDTHTKPSLTDDMRRLNLLASFGIKADLPSTCRQSWLAIIDGGVLKEEQLSAERKLTTSYTFGENIAEIMSQGLTASKSAKAPIEIKINGVEYATNSRGLNFVIWDKKEEKVIDSVAFDFWSGGHIIRKELKND